MADKKERIYIIPLRKEFLKAPKYKRSAKSIRAIKEFIKKHMKVDDVLIGKYLNENVWKTGPKNPPSKVNVKVVKEDKLANVEIIGAPEKKIEEPKEKKPAKKKTEEKTTEKKDDKETKKPSKPETKVPKASELKEKKTEAKKEETKKVPTASELKEKK